MKSILSIVSAFIISFSLSAQTFNVSKDNSTIDWKAAKVSGEHFGKVNIKSGSLKFKNDLLTSGEFTVDMPTITVENIQGEWADKLKGHLNSEDFFSTAKFKEAKLVTKSVKSTGANQYEVTANLTIKGITKEVVFPASLSVEGNNVQGKASIKIDRTKYDIKYGSGSFFEGLGDKMIYDEFTLDVNLIGMKAGN